MTAKRKKRPKSRYSVSRKGMGGRKPRDDSGPGRPLYVRVTAAELETLRAAAAADACSSVASWVRGVALECTRRIAEARHIRANASWSRAKIDTKNDDCSQ